MRKILLLLLVCAFVFGIMPVDITITGEAADYGSNGKFLAPIEPPATRSIAISTKEELAAISSGYYHLTKDIDLSGVEWIPIGKQGNSVGFSGVFDGQGYVIRNLTITGEGYTYNGLFANVMTDAIIKNVGMEGTNINISAPNKENDATGAIAGRLLSGASISNCYNTGTVSVVSEQRAAAEVAVGGIYGDSNGSSRIISNCYNEGTIFASGHHTVIAGGISGSNDHGFSFDNCYNTGTVTASAPHEDDYGTPEARAGGIFAWLGSSSEASVISNCYNAGAISATSTGRATAGGICEDIDGSNSIINCYNKGMVNATSSSDFYGAITAGICANIKNGVSDIINTYCLDKYDNEYGVQLSYEQMKDEASFIGFDFANVWGISPDRNDGHPYLKGALRSGIDVPSDILPFTPIQKRVEFSYGVKPVDRKILQDIYYADAYFYNKSTEYNHNFATMSLALAMSAFNSYNAPTQNYSANVAGKNAKALLEDVGFGNVDISMYEGKPKQDSIAAAFGNKYFVDFESQKPYTVIAVAVRGGGYEAEWAGNFNIKGYNERHDGFDIAAGTVLKGLGDYISANAITGSIKVWVTGYSRGAATANLLAGSLNNGALGAYTTAVSLEENDIYAYTFATPQNTKSTTANDTKYNNIFNIVNPIDIVPKVAMSDWGYTRYGINYYLPCEETFGEEALYPLTQEVIKKYSPSSEKLPQYQRQATKLDQIVSDLSATLGAEKSEKSQRILKQIRDVLARDDMLDVVSSGFMLVFKDIKELEPIYRSILQIPGGNTVEFGDDEILEIIFEAHEPELYLAWMLSLDESHFLSSVPSLWATGQVNSAINAKLVPQSLQSKYTQTTTRAEFCALAVALYETMTSNEISGRSTFADTKDVNVEKMASLSVVSGVGDNRFDPNASLTREQAATMLARLADSIGKPLNKQASTFNDNNSISAWALEAVGQMQTTGIMGGIGDNTFAPHEPYTREQSIVTILRLYDFL